MIIQTDSLKIPLSDESVHCVITSPPYWGLRDYGTAKWEGGDKNCDHQVPLGRKGANAVGTKQTTNPGSYGYREWLVCGKCGAKRIDSQLGLESTPEEYVGKMVEVFREVKRVLRGDGTLWLNLGDSYGGYWGDKYAHKPFGEDRTPDASTPPNKTSLGKMAKNLMGIPWRVAFALQADGWYLRSDIIWSKPNPMPESVTDRPTKAHEYLFLLSKSPRYYYDAEAVREANSENSAKWGKMVPTKTAIAQGKHGKSSALTANMTHEECVEKYYTNGRNIRTVWEIATQPFSEAHFATFPEELVRKCLFAGCPVGGTVFDPFLGSGTVGVVAQKYNRKWVGLELKPDYCRMAKKRTENTNVAMI